MGVAGTGRAAWDALGRTEVDLVLLDMNLPDTHGTELLRRLRAAGRDVDVLAVTSARELATVRAAAAHGVVGYLLKPSPGGAARPAGRLRRAPRGAARRGRRGRPGRRRPGAGPRRPTRPAALPKGMGRETLDAVVAAVRAGDGVSAAEAAEAIGASRITARRYLEHLADNGLVTRQPRYGGTGRPELEYRWQA